MDRYVPGSKLVVLDERERRSTTALLLGGLIVGLCASWLWIKRREQPLEARTRDRA